MAGGLTSSVRCLSHFYCSLGGAGGWSLRCQLTATPSYAWTSQKIDEKNNFGVSAFLEHIKFPFNKKKQKVSPRRLVMPLRLWRLRFTVQVPCTLYLVSVVCETRLNGGDKIVVVNLVMVQVAGFSGHRTEGYKLKLQYAWSSPSWS